MLNSVAENQFKKAQFNFPPNFLSSTLEESSGPVFQNVCLSMCMYVFHQFPGLWANRDIVEELNELEVFEGI